MDRIIFLAIVLVVTTLLSRFISRGMHKLLDKSPLPSTSLYINLIRIMIWAVAVIIVLKPVFGIEANSLITALGIGGVALSLGLQDTISNIISGFGLIAGHAIKPGDYISVNGVTGQVKDITWRHTVVTERGGNQMWIPNSVLNTSALEKKPRTNEAFTKLHILLKPDIDVKETLADIVSTVQYATRHQSLKGTIPSVRLTNFTAYGIEADVILFSRGTTVHDAVKDVAARSLIGKPYMAFVNDILGAAPQPIPELKHVDFVTTQVFNNPAPLTSVKVQEQKTLSEKINDNTAEITTEITDENSIESHQSSKENTNHEG